MKQFSSFNFILFFAVTFLIHVPVLEANAQRVPADSAVLGHTIRCHEASPESRCQLIKIGDPPETIFSGSRKEAEHQLLKRLKQKHGEGNPNLPFWTMGGKQFWADGFIHDNWRIQENVFTGHTRLLDPNDVRKAWGSYEGTRTYFEQLRLAQSIENDSSHLVLLVHGIFRSKDSMSPLKSALEEEGYEVAGINYPSTRQSIGEHARQLERLLDRSIGIERVSFVTHSMGGMVVRKLLGLNNEWRNNITVHRIVMLAPPNQGSEISNAFKDFLPYRIITGESGQELTPKYVRNLPVPDVPVGVIAGESGDSGYNPFLEGNDDGTVRVKSTQIEGMDDFYTVESQHSFIMSQPGAIEATTEFLKTGAF